MKNTKRLQLVSHAIMTAATAANSSGGNKQVTAIHDAGGTPTMFVGATNFAQAS